MIYYQLDLLKTSEQSLQDKIISDLDKVRKSADSVRKGTYARLNEQKREIQDLKNRLEILERFICRQTKEPESKIIDIEEVFYG